MKPFLDRIREPGACLFGTWVKLGSLETLEMLAWAGYDFVVVDTEHSPHSFESTYRCIVAGQGFGMSVLVRLPDLRSQDAPAPTACWCRACATSTTPVTRSTR
jgi:2-keto-3-deoxy-L-rhamnonate aldolase RhmA